MCRIPIDLLTERAPGSREFSQRERERVRSWRGEIERQGRSELAEPADGARQTRRNVRQRRMDVEEGVGERVERRTKRETEERIVEWTYASEGGRVVMR